MEETIDEAIQKMAEQVKASGQDSEKAHKFSIAALNLAHVKQVLKSIEQTGGK